MKALKIALAGLPLLLAGCAGTGDLMGVARGPSSADLLSNAPLGQVVQVSVTSGSAESIHRKLEALNLGKARKARVPFVTKEAPGSIVIDQRQSALFLVEGDGTAWRYQVAVGKPEHQWAGDSQVNGVHFKPAWSPPAIIKQRQPNVPDVIPGGSPNNPMGVGALTLSGGDYAIHGTNRPELIGQSVSYGCFRMRNEDVADLMQKVQIGTKVVVKR
jgi:lipoprotein-anchoring transpeptidase ErfK/SrfK